MAKVKRKEARGIDPKLDKLRQEIHTLSSKLKGLGEEKEAKYKEKNTFDKNLNSYIKSAKELREKKEKIDKEIKKLKVNREGLNKELKSMFTALAALKKKLGITKQKGKRESSEDVFKQIEAMQFAIQTEALSFEREKNYMERIKRLKQKLKEIETEEAKFKELVDFKKEIKKKKEKADSAHAKIQQLANESSKLFNELTNYSEEIAKIKKQKRVLQKKLKSSKAQIDSLNQKLGNLLKEWSEVSSEALAISKEKSWAVMKQKTAEVMDKFKKKKRLTTEDILLLQRQIKK